MAARRTPTLEISAHEVKDACIYNHAIHDQLREIFATIQAAIRESSKHGVSKISVPLPSNFAIPGMPNKTAQTIIYHTLIKELKKNGFDVAIKVSLDVVVFNIGWQIKNSDEELVSMREDIAKYLM
jgi:hypothetical protein